MTPSEQSAILWRIDALLAGHVGMGRKSGVEETEGHHVHMNTVGGIVRIDIVPKR